MTVIAWDGRFLACDMQCTVGNSRVTVSKMVVRAQYNQAIAMTGYLDVMDEFVEYYLDRKKKCPSTEEKLSRLVIVKDGSLSWLESGATEFRPLDKYIAFGMGMEVALGAMYAGANAEKAVLAAIHHSADCGKGVQIYDSETREYRQYFV